jgi:hypothetical protein
MLIGINDGKFMMQLRADFMAQGQQSGKRYWPAA